MTGNTVNGSGNRVRSGAQTLVLLASPLSGLILRALSEGARSQADLRRETGAPAQTTLRSQLKRLAAMGTIEKHRRNRFPGVLEYDLTASGRDLLFVVDALERWLERAPHGPLLLNSSAGSAAIATLADGWSTTMLRVLASGPLSLTELDRIIGSLSYPSLERRLAAMRLAGQIEARSGNGRSTPYAVTDQLREAVAPLAAAARWERRHRPHTTAPVGRLDVEAIFLLAVPLVRLPQGLSGTCWIAAEIPSGKGSRAAGITVQVDNGEIGSYSTDPEQHPTAWALGPPAAWLSALIECDAADLELGGDRRLARALSDGLHRALFGASIGDPHG
ncbi:MAG TPA: winged helix-turn-helix transcriptional regulator [Solirubrobacterales bacterium]